MLKIGMLPRKKLTGGGGSFLLNLASVYKNSGHAQIVSSLNPFQNIGLYSSVVKGLPYKPYVLRMDGIYFDKDEVMGPNSELNKKIYRSIGHANGIIFQSNFSKQLIEYHYGPVSCPSVVINNGARLFNKVRPVSDCQIDQNRKLKIVCSAVWRRHKRLRETIEVVKKLSKNIAVELIVLGEPKEELPQYEFVSFKGNVPQNVLYDYLLNADLFLHLCWLDNCPNSVIEALSCRVPVVCSNLGGTRELIDITHGGQVSNCDEEIDCSEPVKLYDPPVTDIDAIARSVEYVLQHRKSISKNMNLVDIDIDVVARKYLNFLGWTYSGDEYLVSKAS